MVKISKVFDKLESFADDKLQKLNVRGGNNPLIFPTEIENVGQFIKFSVFKEYQFQRDAFEKAETVGTVVLHFLRVLQLHTHQSMLMKNLEFLELQLHKMLEH